MKKTKNQKNKRSLSNQDVAEYRIPIISKQELVEIQSEAYYAALSRIKKENEEAEKGSELVSPKLFSKEWWLYVGSILLFFVFPFITLKRLSVPESVPPKYLKGMATVTIKGTGFLLYVVGLALIIIGISQRNPSSRSVICFGVAALLVGDITILAGNGAERIGLKDVYAFSASVFAMFSMIIALISLIFSVFGKF